MEFTRNYFQIWKFRVQWFSPDCEISEAHYILEFSLAGKYIGYYGDGFHTNIWTKEDVTR